MSDIVNTTTTPYGFGTEYTGNKQGIEYKQLTEMIDQNVNSVKAKLASIKDAGSSVSIGNMFDMQLIMNRLSQFSEMSTALMSAANSTATSVARNIK